MSAIACLLAFGLSTAPWSSFSSAIFRAKSLSPALALASRTRPASHACATPAETSAVARRSCDVLHDANRSRCAVKKSDIFRDAGRPALAAAAAAAARDACEGPRAAGAAADARARAPPGGAPCAPPRAPPPPAPPAPPGLFCLKGSVALQCGHTRVGDPTTPRHSVQSFRPLPSGVPGWCGVYVGVCFLAPPEDGGATVDAPWWPIAPERAGVPGNGPAPAAAAAAWRLFPDPPPLVAPPGEEAACFEALSASLASFSALRFSALRRSARSRFPRVVAARSPPPPRAPRAPPARRARARSVARRAHVRAHRRALRVVRERDSVPGEKPPVASGSLHLPARRRRLAREPGARFPRRVRRARRFRRRRSIVLRREDADGHPKRREPPVHEPRRHRRDGGVRVAPQARDLRANLRPAQHLEVDVLRPELAKRVENLRERRVRPLPLLLRPGARTRGGAFARLRVLVEAPLHALHLRRRVRVHRLADVRQRRSSRRRPPKLAPLRRQNRSRGLVLATEVVALEVRRVAPTLRVRRAQGVELDAATGAGAGAGDERSPGTRDAAGAMMRGVPAAGEEDPPRPAPPGAPPPS